MKPHSKQGTLAMMNGFERYTKKTRRAQFLEEMVQVVPWRKLCALIEPHYPKVGNGRPFLYFGPGYPIMMKSSPSFIAA
jgi:hypothetical protein